MEFSFSAIAFVLPTIRPRTKKELQNFWMSPRCYKGFSVRRQLKVARPNHYAGGKSQHEGD